MTPTAEVVRYGLKSRDARLVASNVRSDGHATLFSASYDGKPLGDVALRVPGTHNVQNALAALGAGFALGVSLDEMRAGLIQFGGVDRRFQRLCDVAGVTIVDDYAHHPTEIIATLQAARAHPIRRAVSWQPFSLIFSHVRAISPKHSPAPWAARTASS